MKKLFSILVLILIFLYLSPSAFAGGNIIVYNEGVWHTYDGRQQCAVIDYENGVQSMFVRVSVGEIFEGNKAIWIFTVPAKPEEISINVVENFPVLEGYDIEKRAAGYTSAILMLVRATHIYPALLFPYSEFFDAQSWNSVVSSMDNLRFANHRIQKDGVKVDIISATDSNLFSQYMINNNLTLPENTRRVLDEYIGHEYSFVVFWISDIDEYKQKTPILYFKNLIDEGNLQKAKSFLDSSSYDSDGAYNYVNKYMNKSLGPQISDRAAFGDNLLRFMAYRRLNSSLNEDSPDRERIKKDISTFLDSGLTAKSYTLGANIQFPTERLYYPLRLTSLSSDEMLSTVIYVRDYANPEISSQIRDDTELNYYTQKSSLKYTRIKISTLSHNLNHDLWIRKSVPFNIKLADFAVQHTLLYGLVLFIVCSCLAAFAAGIVAFRHSNVSYWKFSLLGFFNFFTVICFAVSAYVFLRRESNKVTFVLLFTISFTLLTLIFEFLLNCLLLG